MKDLVLLRANIMGGMNAYIEELGDENIYMEWIYTYPEGATEDDLMELAEDEEYWLHIVAVFERCVRLARM